MREPTHASAYELMLEENVDEANLLNWRRQLCSECDGTGTTWNGVALFASDFDEDPDLGESVMNGSFDRPCETCHGSKVVEAVCPQVTEPSAYAVFEIFLQDIYECRAEEAAERQAGC